jgi:deazaflavin-dependent oxidoreductase (nitroreductase family)
MSKAKQPPLLLWKIMRFMNRRVAAKFSPKLKGGRLVLLLTTTGRKTGLPRLTPLQFEEEGGVLYVASARGQGADWFKNLLACPQVLVQVKGMQFTALAEPVTDQGRIADFLELRVKRHPVMMRLMLRAEGLPLNPRRADLEKLAGRLAVVALHPSAEMKPISLQDLANPEESGRKIL